MHQTPEDSAACSSSSSDTPAAAPDFSQPSVPSPDEASTNTTANPAYLHRTRRGKVVAGITFLLIAIAAWIFLDVPTPEELRHWSQHLGFWFPALFFFLYIAITQFPIPRSVMTFSSGILFGPFLGSVIAIIATTVSAAVSLTVVRGLLKDWIRPRLRHPAVQTINDHLERRGWLAIASLRMIAAVPFCVLNYTAAVTDVRFRPFVFATAVGSAPGTIALVLLGDASTGHANPALLLTTVALFIIGSAGLLLDAKMPLPQSRQPQGSVGEK